MDCPASAEGTGPLASGRESSLSAHQRIATFSKSLVLQKTGFFYGFIFTPVRVACPLASGSPPFLKAPFERLGLFYGLSSQRSEPTAISAASARQCLAPTGLIGGFVYAISTNMAPLRGFFRFLTSSPPRIYCQPPAT